LGLPLSPTYQQRGSLLYRRFQHGFVAMNTGTGPANLIAPAAATEFAEGSQAGVTRTGQTIRLLPRIARFFLTDDYLCSAVAGAGGTPVAAGGELVLRSPAAEHGLTTTYAMDGTRVYRTARFPSSYQLDLGRYSRGTHTLLTDYYYPDGRFSAAARCVTVGNAAAFTPAWFWVGTCAALIGVLTYCAFGRATRASRGLATLRVWRPRA
jgi:hypothetical protein